MPLSSLCFIASSFLLALGSVLAKLLLSSHGSAGAAIDPLPFLALQLLGGVFFLAAIHLVKNRPKAPWRLLRRPALAGVILGFGSIGTIMALALIPASEASVVFATQPVVMIFLARLLLGEQLKPKLVALCAFAVCGVVMIVATSGDTASENRVIALAFAGLSTVCAALYVVWMRGLGGQVDALTALSVVLSVAFIVATLTWFLASTLQLTDPQIAGTTLAASAFGTGVIHYGAAFYVYLLGLRHTEASKAGVYLSLVPVFVIGLAWVILAERFTPLQWVGAVMVICCVGAVSLLTDKKPDQDV